MMPYMIILVIQLFNLISYNYNGIPFNAVVKTERIPKKSNSNIRPPFEYGRMSGNVWMADDFDAPLDDFMEYME